VRYVDFAGLRPKLKPESLSTAFAQEAVNLDLYRGELLPLRGPKLYGQAVSPSGVPLSVAPASLFQVGKLVIGWPQHTWAVIDPRAMPGDTAFMFVEDGAMWWQATSRVVKQLPPIRMGVCRPSAAPTAATLAGAGCAQLATPMECVPGTGDCPEIPPEARAYVCCWVRDYDDCAGRHEQSAPSPPVFVTVQDREAVILTPPAAPLGVTRVMWYRWVAGTNGQSIALFVGEGEPGLPFVDTTCPGDLGHDLPSARWFEPPCDVKGIALAGDNSVVVWSGNRLWMSEPRLPHAFDHDRGVRIIDHQIVGIVGQIQRREAATTYELHIVTDGRPFVAVGPTPEKLEVRMIKEDAPCLSVSSITDMTAGRTGWASPFGFVSTTGDRVVSETDAFMTDNEWGQERPDLMSAFYFNERVWISAETRGLVLGIPSEGGQRPRTLTTMDLRPRCAVQRIGYPPLVAFDSAGVFEWLRGEPLQFRWRSEEAVFAGITTHAAAKVVARRPEIPRDMDELHTQFTRWMRANPGRDPVVFVQQCGNARAAQLINLLCAKVRIWREGSPAQWQHVMVDRPFRLPRLPRALRWSIEVRATFPVIEVHYNTAIADLALEGGSQ
jgi:hypothetical protein